MYKFTWNGLNPWIIFKIIFLKAKYNPPVGFNSRVRYFCFWLEIWSRDFERQNIGTAAIKKKGQTMSNAQVIDKIVEDHKVTKTLNLPPHQGSDEVQVTITVQDEEEVEKKPTIH